MSEDLASDRIKQEHNYFPDPSPNVTGPSHPPTPAVVKLKHLKDNTFNDFVTPTNAMLIGGESRFYHQQFGGPSYHHPDRDNFWVAMDHCYARPYNWRPENSFLRPTKTLFIPKSQTIRKKPNGNPLIPMQIRDPADDLIDVETEPEEPVALYDKAKARAVMDECEKHAALGRTEGSLDNWEENINKIHWNATQNRLFNGMVNILNNDHLARLTYANHRNEPVIRRTTIDKSVERVRKLIATIGWDPKYTQWLHQLLIDNLSTPYLSAYLDILQTLKSKLPTFVDKMMCISNSSKLSVLSYESLFPLMKRPWDPVSGSMLVQDKPKKLPGNPILIVVPSTPIASKRLLKWITLLSNLATVVSVPSNYGSPGHKMSMSSYVDQMFVMTRSKIQDIRAEHPGRNIVLIGFNFGATLALQIAQVEQVLCCVCMGFSLMTAEGRRGEPDDNLLELQCPVLFVVGQCSNTSIQEDMEDLRERMRVETGLIVVGSADENLRVNKKKKKAEGITQSIVDRCITDEIGEFIGGIIVSPYPPQIRQSPTNLTAESMKKIKSERKRYNSNTSSVDSEPPSPTPRISRPVGRPPGSKANKNKQASLEAKWAAAAQQQQGIPPPPPSPSHSPPPPPPSSSQVINIIDTSSNDSFVQDNNYNSSSNSNTPKKINVTGNVTLNPGVNLEQHVPVLASSSSSSIGASTGTVKKIKTLKPVVQSSSHQQHSSSASSTPEKHQQQSFTTLGPSGHQIGAPIPAKPSQAKALNYQNRQLSSYFQGDVPSMKPSSSGIKVLENVKLSSATNPKLLTTIGGRPIDMSKISVINPTKSVSGNSIVFLPDGNIKKINPGQRQPRARYITSKRQLLGNKPPKPVKKIHYMPQTCHQMQTSDFPPPTNLTTQDILDLPIIFADDNQMLDNSISNNNNPSPQQQQHRHNHHQQHAAELMKPAPVPQIVNVTNQQQPQKIFTSGHSSSTAPSVAGPSKFLLINKQVSLQNSSSNNNFIITSSSGSSVSTGNNKMVVSQQQQQQGKVPPKYTKIILSTKKVAPPMAAEESKPQVSVPSTSSFVTKITNLPPEISIKKITTPVVRKSSPQPEPQPIVEPVMEPMDLEKEIVATTVYKKSAATTAVMDDRNEEMACKSEQSEVDDLAIENDVQETPTDLSKTGPEQSQHQQQQQGQKRTREESEDVVDDDNTGLDSGDVVPISKVCKMEEEDK